METNYYPSQPASMFPGEIRADEDYMAKYDIDRWLEIGHTDHFMVPEIYKVQS
jgi:hypothetical protein